MRWAVTTKAVRPSGVSARASPTSSWETARNVRSTVTDSVLKDVSVGDEFCSAEYSWGINKNFNNVDFWSNDGMIEL